MIARVDLEPATTKKEKAFIFTAYQREKHCIRYHIVYGVLMQSDAFHSIGMRLDEGYHGCLLSLFDTRVHESCRKVKSESRLFQQFIMFTRIGNDTSFRH